MVNQDRTNCQGPADPSSPLSNRRTARAFDEARTIPARDLERLLRLASTAPSSHNLQPWRFIVVRSTPARRLVQGRCFGQRRLSQAPAIILALAYHHSHHTDLEAVLSCRPDPADPRLGAPEALPGLASQTVGRWPDPSAWAVRATMMAVANLLTAAQASGLASALIDDFDGASLSADFGVPADHSLCAVVALGYPPPGHTEPDPGRFPLEDFIYDEHFGAPWKREGSP